MLKERIARLLPKYMDNSCNPEEEEEFLRLVAQSARDEEVLELLETAWRNHVSDQRIGRDASDRIFQFIISSGQLPAGQPSIPAHRASIPFRDLSIPINEPSIPIQGSPIHTDQSPIPAGQSSIPAGQFPNLASQSRVQSDQSSIPGGEAPTPVPGSSIPIIRSSNKVFRFPKKVLHSSDKVPHSSHPVYWLQSSWFRYAAVLLLIAGTTFFFYRKNLFRQPAARVYAQQVSIHNDVLAPDSVHATITTASGNRIVLDNMKDGALSGNLQKVSNDNIVYHPGNNDKIEYNTLSVPRGSKVISITLSDASKVWLNAGSSLTYPSVFTGTKRLVTITGEAYFEITPNIKMPFTVEKGDARIQVLGTHFNVNAYDDEATIKVTLLKGSVKVSQGQKAVTLTPGQQAQLNATGNIQLTEETDLDEVMAWKMGRFVFNDADIKAIMRQAMKWYDVDVVYEGRFPDRYFTADISRNTNLSELLKVLELSNISFQLQGKKLIVKP